MISSTIFYFCKPLDRQIGLKRGLKITETTLSVALLALFLVGLFYLQMNPYKIAEIGIGVSAAWLVGNGVSFLFYKKTKREETTPIPPQETKIEEKRPLPVVRSGGGSIVVNPEQIKERLVPLDQIEIQSPWDLEKLEGTPERVEYLIQEATAYFDDPKHPHRQEHRHLLKDFENVREEEVSDGEKCLMLEKMYEALPYHLKEITYEFSQFPLVGIPNVSGVNCHFNAALQFLAHSRCCDYDLWRPIREDRPEILDPLPPAPPKEVKPPKEVNFKRLLKRQDELQAARVQFKEENEKYLAYLAQKKAYDELAEKWKTYPEKKIPFDLKREKIRKLRALVSRLRNGEKLKESELPHFRTGDHTWFLDLIGLKTRTCLPSELESGILETTPWSVLIMGSGVHYKVLVKKEEGLFEINDSSRFKSDYTYEYLRFERNYQILLLDLVADE